MHASLYGAIFINIDCTKLELQEVQDMIIYFSGTGNSRYIAKRIADNIRDELMMQTIRLRDVTQELYK